MSLAIAGVYEQALSLRESRATARRGAVRLICSFDLSPREKPSPAATASDPPEGGCRQRGCRQRDLQIPKHLTLNDFVNDGSDRKSVRAGFLKDRFDLFAIGELNLAAR